MAILTFRVKGQTLTVESKINKIVENSVNYLDYEIIYDDKKWDPPLAKKVVVTYDKKTYEIFGDKIPSQAIHAPGFTVSVIGYKSDSEDDSGIIITTYPVAIKVFPSGAIKGTIPEDTAIDLSVAEQLNEKIEIQANEIKNNYLSKDLLRILINENSTNLEVPTAKAVYDCVETLKTEIMGDLDEIGDLVGGKDDGVYRINGFAYYEDMECYIAPIDSFPDVEAGIYRITINGETVDGSVSRYTDESGSEVVYIASNGTPKIYLMLMGGGDFSESEENFFGSYGIAQSLYPVEEVVELKFTKPEDMIDWGVYIEASYDEGSACYHAYFELDNFDKNAEATYDFAMYDSNNNLIYNPSSRLLNTGYNEFAGMFSSFDNGIGNEEYEVIRNSMDTNSPIKFVFTQTLENGVVNTKTVSGVPVIRNDIIYHEGKEFYCWGNIDAFIVGA